MARVGKTRITDWIPRPNRRYRVILSVEAADEIPKRIPRRGVVLVRQEQSPTWMAFDCPCADRHRVMLNLDRRRRPYWSISDAKRITVSPSIDETRGDCRCHYFLRGGRVERIPRSIVG